MLLQFLIDFYVRQLYQNYLKLKNYFLTKNIIILTSNISRFENIKLGKTTDFIESPSSDAWQSYDEIKSKLLTLIQNKNLNNKETLILISMGSAAKVLVYDLTLLGYIAWDTGQFFDLASKEIENLSN